jgi:hypothetical protein
MIIGGISFSQEGIDSLTEEQFKALYRGKINIDLGEAWQIVRMNKTKLCEGDFQERLNKRKKK